MAETEQKATRLVGVRQGSAGKIDYLPAPGFELLVGEYVVIETDHGPELARVVIAPGQMLGGDVPAGSGRVLRLGTGEDRAARTHWDSQQPAALELARLRSGELGLGLMIVAARYNLDGSSLTLYYEAEDHVDYRPLVRALSSEMEVRIRLERVGPRDRAKITDGYDRCGLRLCCASWLTSFPSVSIKMAKEQNLPLNPSKISGVCGRLYCCLTYEYEVYRELRGTLPKVNTRVSTPTGMAKVISVNPLRQSVTLVMEGDRTRIEVTKDQLEYGKLVRPAEVELGEPQLTDEDREAKTSVISIADMPPPRREGPTGRGARPRSPIPAPRGGRSRRSVEEPVAGDASSAPEPALEPREPGEGSVPSGTDDQRRRKRRRRRRGGGSS